MKDLIHFEGQNMQIFWSKIRIKLFYNIQNALIGPTVFQTFLIWSIPAETLTLK